MPAEVVQHLSGWAHKTTVLVKPKAKAEPRSYTVRSDKQLDALLQLKSRIAKLAAAPNEARMKKIKENLPDIPLEEDECLALVDSGSTINAADIEAYFPEYLKLIIASRAQDMGESATTAGGHQLRNEGRCRIEATVDGLDFPIPFQNMKVDVPILSVRKYVRNGLGFHFEENGGYMQCKANNKKFAFIEADGAYWIKLKIKLPDNSAPPNTGFGRPGRP